MLKRFLLFSLFYVGTCQAGSLQGGTWQPSNCGTSPEPPTVTANNIDFYNASVKAINEWQQAAKTHDDCTVKEANADSALIVKTVTDQQAKLKEVVNRLDNELKAAREKLEKK